MIKHIFLDFNGTLLDDLDLCLDLLNWMLKDQNKPIVKKDKYKNIFTFPVKNYYIKMIHHIIYLNLFINIIISFSNGFYCNY